MGVFENQAIRNVNNHYGPRDTGGTQGDNKYNRTFSINFDGARLPFKFPITGSNIIITNVFDEAVTGTVTALTIGGVNIAGASPTSPVALASNNNGTIVATGPTAGTLTFEYQRYAG